jgi:biotin operon repressor
MNSNKKNNHSDDSIIEMIAGKVVEKIKNDLKLSDAKQEFLSARSIATILDCSISEVRKRIQENGIPTVPFGASGYRVSRVEFERRLARWQAGGDLWD